MRQSLLALAVVLLSGCTWLSTGVPSDDGSSSSSSSSEEAMIEESSAMMQDEDAAMQEEAASTSAAAMQQQSSAPAVAVSADAMVGATGVYTPYHDGVIGNGETSVLFFHATWCPTCKHANSALLQWYGAGAVPLTVYKVDYDTQTALKSRYGITTQHTFVKIDGKGEVISRLQGPSDAELKKFIGA